jgi:hypothetical protein
MSFTVFVGVLTTGVTFAQFIPSTEYCQFTIEPLLPDKVRISPADWPKHKVDSRGDICPPTDF